MSGANDVNGDGGDGRVGDIGHHTKHHAYKEVHQKLWPEETMDHVCCRKKGRRDQNRDRRGELSFQNDLAITPESRFFRDGGNQRCHRYHQHRGVQWVTRTLAGIFTSWTSTLQYPD